MMGMHDQDHSRPPRDRGTARHALFLALALALTLAGAAQAADPPGEGLALWLRADALSGLSDGQAVTNWTDSSSNANHAVQPSSGNAPLFKPNLLNGKPMLRFDGNGDYFDLTSALGLGTAHTFFFVDSTGAKSVCVLIGSTSPIANYNSDGGKHTYNAGGDWVQVTGMALGTPTVRSLFRAGTTRVDVFENGALEGYGSIAANNSFMIRQVGRRADSSTYDYEGDMAELLVYNITLSTNSRQYVEGILAWKYGLQTNLPADHPWRYFEPGTVPEIANRTPTDVTPTSARLNGYLSVTGLSAAAAWVYWGTADGGTNPANWHTGVLVNANQPTGAVTWATADTESLDANQLYVYRFCASNQSARVWASPAEPFLTGPVWVGSPDSVASEIGPDLGSFSLHRPPALTNAAITLCCAFSGSAGYGTDYDVSPPGSNLLLAAGVSNALLTVTPRADIEFNEGTESAVLTLLPGAYTLGTPSNRTVTIADNPTRTFSGWRYRCRIACRGYPGPEVLTNFPLLVLLGPGTIPTFSYSQFASAAGADLRFAASNEIDELPYEIEAWDTNGTSIAWVRIPSIARSNDFFYAYWGRLGAAAPAYSTNGATWSQGYTGVWHMVASNAPESTGSRNHGTAHGNESITGRIGIAQDFTAVTEYLETANAVGLAGSTPRTISFWLYPRSSSGRQCLVLWGQNTDYKSFYVEYNAYGGPGQQIGIDTWNCFYRAGDVLPLTNWHHVAVVYPGGLLSGSRIYLNSRLQTLTLAAGVDSTPNTTDTRASMGYDSVALRNPFDGALDEVRLSPTARSSNWVWACWISQASNTWFCGYAPAESQAPPGLLLSVW